VLQDALTFMAGGPEPPRYAYATIMFNTVEEPYLEDYIIGPLGSPNETTYGPYSFTTTKGTSRVRNFDADEDRTYEFFSATAATCDDIFEDLIGAPSGEYDLWGIDPLWHEEGRVISWVGAWGRPTSVFDGQTLLPQGIYMKVRALGVS